MRLQVGRLPAPLWMRAIIPIASVFVTFLLTSGFVIAVGASPLHAAYYFLLDPLSNPVRGIEVLVKATPLLMTGAAVAFAFAGGYWNIGVEGQLYMGATAATAIGLQMGAAPAWIPLPLVVIGGFLAGMAWAALPAASTCSAAWAPPTREASASTSPGEWDAKWSSAEHYSNALAPTGEVWASADEGGSWRQVAAHLPQVLSIATFER